MTPSPRGPFALARRGIVVCRGPGEVLAPIDTTPASPQYASVLREWVRALDHYGVPASWQVETPQEKFQRLARDWHANVGLSSLARDRAMHPAYQHVIGMGWDAVPFLLQELERSPDHWFWALKAITGVDPVPPVARGDIRAMAEAWVLWGREQGWIR